MSIEEIISMLENVKRYSSGYMARCPAHEDRNPSLSISEGNDGRVLLHCFAGCTLNEIVDAMGIKISDLFPDGVSKDSDRIKKKKREKSYHKKLTDFEDKAFILLVELKEHIEAILHQEKLEISGAYLEAIHNLAIIDYYIEQLTTGDRQSIEALLEDLTFRRWVKIASEYYKKARKIS